MEERTEECSDDSDNDDWLISLLLAVFCFCFLRLWLNCITPALGKLFIFFFYENRTLTSEEDKSYSLDTGETLYCLMSVPFLRVRHLSFVQV